MKKLTAMLLSLVMCLSLLALPAQAAFIPVPDGPGITGTGGLMNPEDPTDPDNDDSDDPGAPVQPMRVPEEMEEVPID